MVPSVLIIEDDDALQHMYETAFKLEGFNVTIAGEAGTALIRASETVFDAIIVDMMLPGMSGLDFIKELRAKYPDLTSKVIVASNMDSETVINKATEAHIDGYFVKSSVDPQKISAYVSSVIKPAAPAASDGTAPAPNPADGNPAQQ